ncbi:MAG: sulfite exporter TauE/SafE family protein [Clostridia bacterium]|nr:sulfite exporter TauE/SafE family protein [Clostridia bacterium]
MADESVCNSNARGRRKINGVLIMVKILFLAVVGVMAGVLGGMGMGGGAILIPLLTVFFKVDQISAQAINLVAFIPMAIVSLIIHVKNKRVEKEGLLWIILPASACSLSGSLLALVVKGSLLKRFFGGFLIALSIMQFFSDKIAEKIKEKQQK